MLTKMPHTADLLCEFLTEELPPLNLEKNIAATFAEYLSAHLISFCSANTLTTEYFVTPRRFGCIIKNIARQETEQKISKKGPSISSGLKDNQPTNALIGFAKSCSITNWQDLEQKNDGYFYAIKTTPGRDLEQVLPEAIHASLKKLPIAKNMRWGENDYSFVRPVHNLVIMFGEQVICQNSSILGLSPVNYTYGHRIMSEGKITLTNPSTYSIQLETEGMVYVNFAKRRNLIKQSLEQHAKQFNLVINDMPGLLDEVTALVEYPVVLSGEFDASFLNVPQECLILSMAKNQKYFALIDNKGKLSNKFLFVANIASTNPQIIIEGNQKVLAARLSDAKFFYEVDLKSNLNKSAEKLNSVVYHNLLGSQLDRIKRLQQIAKKIAPILTLPPEIASDTAFLIKADLTTEMVGEFPELQGIMGKYYAQAEGKSSDVANAIEKHYYPRFSGDKLPGTPLATVMALTDKLETLIGIWGIGLVPTGEKDPFALRRSALGIVRILLNQDKFLIKDLLNITYTTFNGLNLNPNTVDEVYEYILQRLANYLTSVEKFSNNCVQSVLNNKPLFFNHLPSLLRILQDFANNKANLPILQANKRIRNILEKNNFLSNSIEQLPTNNPFNTTEENTIWNLFISNQPKINLAGETHNWEELFRLLATFNQPITDFFANIMVMDKDNPDLTRQRIILLQHLYAMFNQICNLSELVT